MKGSASCSICRAGKFGTSLDTCTNCPLGQYRKGGGGGGGDGELQATPTMCNLCPAGFHQDTLGQASCLPCSPSVSQDQAGQVICDKCEINFFSNDTELQQCFKCAVGQTTNDKQGAASCQDCMAGKFGANCDKCPSGQFRSAESTDPTKCISCLPGFYRNETGKATCLACTPGQYQPSSNSIECIKCKNGQYSVATNAIKCTACPLGSGTFQDGSAFCEFIFVCLFELKIDSDGKKILLLLLLLLSSSSSFFFFFFLLLPPPLFFITGAPCAKGKYSNKQTNNQCNECQIQTFADKENSHNCQPCPGGKFAPSLGALQCSDPETGCTPQPDTVTLDRVEGDPFSIRVSWSHAKCSEPDPQPAPGTWSCPLDEKCFNQQEDPTGFAIRFSTTREFSVEETTLLPHIKSGDAKGTKGAEDAVRSVVVQVNRQVETWLLPDETFIQVRAVVEKVTSDPNQMTTIASLWSVSTEPWTLADSCGDYEFLNNTMDPNRWYCEDCPHGGACRGPTVWNDVRPLAGFWRVPWSPEEFKRCPFVKDCSGADPTSGRRRKFGVNGTEKNASSSDGCILGTRSILCSQCDSGYNRDAATCTQCEDSSMPVRIALLTVCALLVLLLLGYCKRKLKTAWRKYRSLYRDVLRIVSIFVTFSQINTSIPSIIEVPWPESFVNFVANFNVVNVDLFSLVGVSCVGNFNFYLGFLAMLSLPVFIIVWVVFTLYTSITTMKNRVAHMSESDKELQREEAYHTLYHLTDEDGGGEVSPTEFHSLLIKIGWNVDPVQCEQLILAMNEGNDSKEFRNARGQICLKEHVFVGHMINGALKIALEKFDIKQSSSSHLLSDKDKLVGKFLFFLNTLFFKFLKFPFQNYIFWIEFFFSFLLLYSKISTTLTFFLLFFLSEWVLTRGIVSRTMAGAMSLLLLSHTPVSRKVFQFFYCQDMGGRAYMRADYSIRCWSDPWFAFLPLILIVLFAFTILLPVSIGFYLWYHRHQLYSAKIQQRIGWLYDPYRKGAEFWQVHDIVLKMILTGMLIYVPSAMRASVATMLTVIAIANLNLHTPHKSVVLFWLTQISFMVTCFKYLTALMIGAVKLDNSFEGSIESFGLILILLDIIFMTSACIAVIFTVWRIRDKIKKMKGVKKKLKTVIKKYSAKMRSNDWLNHLKAVAAHEEMAEQLGGSKSKGGGTDSKSKTSSKTKVQPIVQNQSTNIEEKNGKEMALLLDESTEMARNWGLTAI